MNPIEVAVIGLGYWGPNLVRVLSENPGWKLTLCCDLDQAKLDRIQRRFPFVKTTRSIEDVWKSSVQAVVIATPVHTHGGLAREALRAGKHVLIEKPLATSSQEGEQVIASASAEHRVLMVGHTFLFSPPVLKVKSLIDAAELGDIYYISSSRVNLGLYQKDIDVLWDLGPHDLSILFFWMRESPSRIAARGRACIHKDLHDVVFLTLEFPSGVMAHVELSWIAPNKLRRTVVVGSRQMVVYDDTDPNAKVKIYDKGVLFKQPETFGEWQLTYRTGSVVCPALDNYEPLAAEADHFLGCIKSGKEPRSGGELGLQVVKSLEAAVKSLAAQGAFQELRRVQLQPAGAE